MFAVGVLAFLFVDVFEHAFEIVEEAVEGFKDGEQGFGRAIGLTALLGRRVRAGTAGLAIVERWLRPKGPTRRRSPAASTRAGSAEDRSSCELATEASAGTGAAHRHDDRRGDRPAQLRRGPGDRRIGQHRRDRPCHRPDHRLRAAQRHRGLRDRRPARRRPSLLALAGAGRPVGGGPTFLGVDLGYNVTSEPLELPSTRVSGGAILYVIGEVWNGMRRYGHRELGLWLLSRGFLVGIVTDLVVVYGGG